MAESELEALVGLVDEYRDRVVATLDGLTEEEARRRLVPSRTTLLGLVRHLTFVEAVWFHEAVVGTPRAEFGLGATPHASFTCRRTDTVASVVARHREVVAGSRENLAGLGPDDEVPGRLNAPGPVTVRRLLLQVLRELAQHCGHLDILREQVLAARDQ